MLCCAIPLAVDEAGLGDIIGSGVPPTAMEVEHPAVTSVVRFEQIRVDVVNGDPGHEDALVELAVGVVHGGGAGGIRQECPGLD